MRQFRCPRCGKGKLFAGFLTIARECGECGLPLKKHEQGDGPAFFAVLLVGALVAISAAVVEIKFAPPFWLHAALWLPLTLLATLFGLRWLKAALITMQYRLRKDDFS